MPAEQQVLVKYAIQVQMLCSVLSAKPIGAVEELEAVIDSADVTCTVSIIRGRGTACFKIQEAVVEKDRKEGK